jgi:hypothetical protein
MDDIPPTSPTVVGVGQAMPESQQQSTTIQDNTYQNLHAFTKKVLGARRKKVKF